MTATWPPARGSAERSKCGPTETANGSRSARLWVRGFSFSPHSHSHNGHLLCSWHADGREEPETKRDNPNPMTFSADGNRAGEIWAIVLSADGQYLAATSFDGRINVWDDLADGAKIREFETKGSFGMSIDMVWTRTTRSTPGTANEMTSLSTGDLRPQAMRMVQSTSSTMKLGGFCTPCRVCLE